jgi:hypothetical protein
MANGTLKVSNIETSSGSGTITIGQSGETVNIPSGTTVSGAVANTPSWLAIASSNQAVANVTNTQIALGTEVFDTDNAFASNTFTCPSDKAGKYMLQLQFRINSMSDGKETQVFFRKGGSADFGEGGGNTYLVANEAIGGAFSIYYSHTAIVDLSAGDAIDCAIYHNNGDSRDLNATYTRFSGFRLIGA